MNNVWSTPSSPSSDHILASDLSCSDGDQFIELNDSDTAVSRPNQVNPLFLFRSQYPILRLHCGKSHFGLTQDGGHDHDRAYVGLIKQCVQDLYPSLVVVEK